MALYSHLQGVRNSALAMATIALMGMAAAKRQLAFTEFDDLTDGTHSLQLIYERSRGQLDAVQELCWPILGETETRKLIEEARKAVGYDPVKANELQVHAGATLVSVPSKTSYASTPRTGGNVYVGGGQQSFSTAPPANDATEDADWEHGVALMTEDDEMRFLVDEYEILGSTPEALRYVQDLAALMGRKVSLDDLLDYQLRKVTADG